METYSVEMVDVRLEGGPTHLPAAMRHQQVSAADHKIKLQYNGGYEHFERTSSDGIPLVFLWSGSTRIAE
jgi:hypothetical protein